MLLGYSQENKQTIHTFVFLKQSSLILKVFMNCVGEKLYNNLEKNIFLLST